MRIDGLEFISSSFADNFSIQFGANLPATGNNLGELFYKTGDALYVYDGSQWINAGGPITTSLGALSGSGLLVRNSNGTWSIDTNSYLTGNQTITVSGDVSGSGSTAITLALSASGVTAGTYNNSVTAITPFAVDSKGRVVSTGAAVTITPAWSSVTGKPTTLSGYGITDAAASSHNHTGVYQPLDADLTSIAGLAGTSGLLKKTAADTWSLDTSSYLTGNQSITVSGDATGTGATAIALTLAASGVTAGTYNNVASSVQPFTVDAKGRITSVGAAVTITPAWSSITSKPTTLSGYGITDAATSTHNHDGIYQPVDADLTAIAALAGTSGLLKKTAADTWTLDTASYAGLDSPAFTGTPTAPTPSTGDRSTQIATMAKFTDEFASSIAANGYQKLPTGIIIQWGTATVSATSASTTVTFPITFPTAFRSASVVAADSGTATAYRVSINTPLAASMKLTNTASFSVTAYWIAIGN